MVWRIGVERRGLVAKRALGRLTMLFGTTPSSPEFRPEKSCFHESFVAVLHSFDNLTIPFHCTDYYCKSSLIFSDDDPPELSIQHLIATRFWALLFSDIEDVADYESRMFHSGRAFGYASVLMEASRLSGGKMTARTDATKERYEPKHAIPCF